MWAAASLFGLNHKSGTFSVTKARQFDTNFRHNFTWDCCQIQLQWSTINKVKGCFRGLDASSNLYLTGTQIYCIHKCLSLKSSGVQRRYEDGKVPALKAAQGCRSYPLRKLVLCGTFKNPFSCLRCMQREN